MTYNPSKQYAKPRVGGQAAASSATSKPPDGIVSTAASVASSTAVSSSGAGTLSARGEAADTEPPNNSINTQSSASAVVSAADIDNNKMNARLKEMFKERITAFREGVYLLTGYKVTLPSGDRIVKRREFTIFVICGFGHLWGNVQTIL